MKSFLRRGLSILSPDQTSSGPRSITTASEDALFPKVNPEVDGEDCTQDCASCTIHYPAKFDVEMTDKLYGHVKGWATHVLVATGKMDWVRDVADEQGSVMEAIEKAGLEPSNGKLKLSASNLPLPDEYHQHEPGDQPTSVLILPAFTYVDHVTPSRTPDLIKYFINTSPTTTTPLFNPAVLSPSQAETEQLQRSQQPEGQEEQATQAVIDINSLTPLRSRRCPHAAVILLCSQRTRDARCGQSAPLLRREFERHLRTHGLHRDTHDERPGGVGIYFISHVGGHKYAANVIIYRRRHFEWFKQKQSDSKDGAEAKADDTGGTDTEEISDDPWSEGAAQGIWLARVRPEECKGIVEFTVLQGKVVNPARQLRGGFDRQKGLISW